ncbi:hypothetical protein AB0I95_21750 [Micromonospora sp. NPDC049751]|uniref:hypothetical protein n=1 Tax=Micromonospora sp. NPDC049751 TaxID=3154837 RepID=UPI003409D9BB
MTTTDDFDPARSRPTAADRRWEVLAEEMQFNQLGIARRQAEGWRNGLAACATLLATATLVKGRPDFDKLVGVWRVVPVVLILLAFGCLAAAFLVAIRAAHGRPGTYVLADGASLREWTEMEVKRIARLIPWAAWLSLAGLTLVLVAAVVTWTGPVIRP